MNEHGFNASRRMGQALQYEPATGRMRGEPKEGRAERLSLPTKCQWTRCGGRGRVTGIRQIDRSAGRQQDSETGRQKTDLEFKLYMQWK